MRARLLQKIMNDNRDEFISRLSAIRDSQKRTHYGSTLSSRSNQDLKEWLIANTPDDCTSLTERMMIILDGNDPHICSHGNRKPYNLGGFRYCSADCQCLRDTWKEAAQRSKETRIKTHGGFWTAEMTEKTVQTNRERYGAEHYLKTEEGKNVYKQKLEEKYGEGVSSTLQLAQVKEQIKQTVLNRYGVDHNSKIPEVQEKRVLSRIENHGMYWNAEMQEKAESTSMSRYGVPHYARSHEGRIRMSRVLAEKYGEDIKSTLQLTHVKERIKQTNLEKYGVEHLSQSEEFREKRKEQNIEKYGVPYHSQSHLSPENVEIFNDDEKFAEIYQKYSTIKEISGVLGYTESPIRQRASLLGLERKLYPGISEEEHLLGEFLSKYTTVIRNTRSVIPPMEIDIFLPEHNIGIEYNGVYWHSLKFLDKNYHLNKTNQALVKGIRLIHIFSDDMYTNPDIVHSRLLSMIGKSTRISARECEIREIDYHTYSDFFETTHIQGNIKADICYGLFLQDELISAMSLGKPRFAKKFQWELLRFSSKLNTIVQGGASRLFKKFLSVHDPESVISYANRSWGEGGVYQHMGFALSGYTPPNYSYLISGIRRGRYQYQKHLLKEKLKDYNSELTEEQNMLNNGYYRIYDSGNTVWKYTKP